MNPFSLAWFATERIPFTLFISPFSANSPTTIDLCKRSAESCPEAVSNEIAIGRSNEGPDFLNCAGARLIVFLSIGKVRFEFLTAERTRSFASWTEVSPNPTIVKEGSPLKISASTSTISAESPLIATV